MPNSKYFKNINSIEDLKKQYRKLAMQYHPDLNPGINDQIMKDINNEYELLFNYITAHQTDKQREQTQKAGHNINDGYREAILAIIHLPGIEIEICGSWVWVSGETKQYKDIFNNNNYHWASKKVMWYFRPEQYKSYNKKPFSMDYIRNKYGSERIATNPHKQLDQAI